MYRKLRVLPFDTPAVSPYFHESSIRNFADRSFRSLVIFPVRNFVSPS
jgi:hypothetical protein